MFWWLAEYKWKVSIYINVFLTGSEKYLFNINNLFLFYFCFSGFVFQNIGVRRFFNNIISPTLGSRWPIVYVNRARPAANPRLRETNFIFFFFSFPSFTAAVYSVTFLREIFCFELIYLTRKRVFYYIMFPNFFKNMRTSNTCP